MATFKGGRLCVFRRGKQKCQNITIAIVVGFLISAFLINLGDIFHLYPQIHLAVRVPDDRQAELLKAPSRGPDETPEEETRETTGIAAQSEQKPKEETKDTGERKVENEERTKGDGERSEQANGKENDAKKDQSENQSEQKSSEEKKDTGERKPGKEEEAEGEGERAEQANGERSDDKKDQSESKQSGEGGEQNSAEDGEAGSDGEVRETADVRPDDAGGGDQDRVKTVGHSQEKASLRSEAERDGQQNGESGTSVVMAKSTEKNRNSQDRSEITPSPEQPTQADAKEPEVDHKVGGQGSTGEGTPTGTNEPNHRNKDGADQNGEGPQATTHESEPQQSDPGSETGAGDLEGLTTAFADSKSPTYNVDLDSPFLKSEGGDHRKNGEVRNFDNFNNETGVDELIIPNTVHFIRFGNNTLRFIDALCIKAAFVKQKPDKLMIHTDFGKPIGKYWDWLLTTEGLVDALEVKEISCPTHVFGQKLSEDWGTFHGSDISRLLILMKFGGIYLDNDCFVVQSLDCFRHFEMVLECDDGLFIGNQVLMAHPDARILPKWLETYRFYDRNKWYYNGGERPTKELLYKHPELVHRVKKLFGSRTLIGEMFDQESYWPKWREQYIIHLLYSHRSYMVEEEFKLRPEIDEFNIMGYNATFGEMAREIYNA